MLHDRWTDTVRLKKSVILTVLGQSRWTLRRVIRGWRACWPLQGLAGSTACSKINARSTVVITYIRISGKLNWPNGTYIVIKVINSIDFKLFWIYPNQFRMRSPQTILYQLIQSVFFHICISPSLCIYLYTGFPIKDTRYSKLKNILFLLSDEKEGQIL